MMVWKGVRGLIKKIIRKLPFIYGFCYKQMCAIKKYREALQQATQEESYYRYGTVYSNKMEKLRGKYKGERCFIIGNGPSLSIEDLNKLKNEYTFAANRIFGLYDKTDWRPTFYCVQDYAFIREMSSKIKEVIDEAQYNFFPYNMENVYLGRTTRKKNVQRFFLDFTSFIPEKGPKFSNQANERIYEGFTVTYASIQLAYYMGFEKIYLLGVDHSANSYAAALGTVNMENLNLAQTDKATLAYMVAAEHAKNNNYRIYNATRGGYLEVFDRIDFDKLFTD